MTSETTPDFVEDLLASYDVSALQAIPTWDVINDVTSKSSAPSSFNETPPPEARKRGRKKQNIDPATRLEMDRLKDRNRCSRYRQRQRSEREKLQLEVRDLTADLKARQKAQEASRALSTSAWKMLAQSELEARLNSEEQQRRLCEAVEVRTMFIREFHKSLQQNPPANVVEEKEKEPIRQKKIRLEPSDAAFYDVFVQDLNAIYAQTDHTLRACGLDAMSDEHIAPRQVWKEDGSTGYFMYIDKHVIPLEFERTCEIFWQAGKLPFRQQDRQDFKGVGDPANTAAFKFRVTNRLSTGRIVSALVRFVTRCYEEKDRVVVVWQSVMEGEGIFTGMRAGETGWDVLTRSTVTLKTGSVVKTCICHTPMHLSTVATHEAAVKQFTGMMLGSVADDGLEIAKMFENLQLDGK